MLDKTQQATMQMQQGSTYGMQTPYNSHHQPTGGYYQQPPLYGYPHSPYYPQQNFYGNQPCYQNPMYGNQIPMYGNQPPMYGSQYYGNYGMPYNSNFRPNYPNPYHPQWINWFLYKKQSYIYNIFMAYINHDCFDLKKWVWMPFLFTI